MTPLAPPFGHPRSGRRGFVPRKPILGTISDLTATAADGEVTLEWTAPVGGILYQVQYKLSTDEEWTDWGIEGDGPDPYYTTPPAVGPLTNDSAYDFRVIVDDGDTTTTSNTDSATPSATAGFGTVDDLTEDAKTDTTMTVEFEQVADDQGNPAKYAIRYRENSISEETWGQASDTEEFIDTSLAIGVLKQHTFTDLVAGTDYGIMLIPFRGTPGSADAFGDFSNAITITTTGTSTLGTITDLSPAAGNTQVSLSWTPASNATSHQPQYKESSSGTWLDFGTALGGSAGSVVVTGLTNDTAYDFRVVAGDGSTTTNSNEVSATPTASAYPNEPAGFTVHRHWDGSALVPDGWTEHDTGPAKHSREPEDGTLNSGNSHFYRHTYPAGMSEDGKGTEYINTAGGGWFPSGEAERLYVHFWIRPSAGWVGHQSGINKIIYFGGNSNGSFANHMGLLAQGIGSGTLNIALFAQNLGHSCPDSIHIFTSSAVIPRGQWTRIEVLITMNTAGNRDGAFKIWKNGSLVMDESGTDCWFEFSNSDSGTVHRFIGSEVNTIWGGRGTGTLAETQTLDHDDIRLSGGPR